MPQAKMQFGCSISPLQPYLFYNSVSASAVIGSWDTNLSFCFENVSMDLSFDRFFGRQPKLPTDVNIGHISDESVWVVPILERFLKGAYWRSWPCARWHHLPTVCPEQKKIAQGSFGQSFFAHPASRSHRSETSPKLPKMSESHSLATTWDGSFSISCSQVWEF